MKENYNARIDKAKSAIKSAEYILIGGGSGLSAAAGMTYFGERFIRCFADFIKLYGIEDMYSATFYPFKTQEERWAYFSRHIMINRFNNEAGKIYSDLKKLVQGKSYFVITTNVDAQFAIAGFEPEKIFATQGDYGKLQCAVSCHNKLYDNEQIMRAMVNEQKDCKIPSMLVPKCPVCRGEMEVNLRKDDFFVQDNYWFECSSRFEYFLKEFKGHKLVFIEIGVGFNTPGIIRFPFEQITYTEPQATLIRINKDYAEPLKENEAKTLSFFENAE